MSTRLSLASVAGCALLAILTSPRLLAEAPAQPGAPQVLGRSLQIVQLKLGSVFLQGEPVRFQIKGRAPSVRWQASSFGGRQLASGALALHDGAATLSLQLARLGYFSLHIDFDATGFGGAIHRLDAGRTG